MFIEHRIYSLTTASLPEYYAAFGAKGYKLHTDIVPCLGWYFSEAGMQSQMVSLWRYESLVDRMRRRSDLSANPEWQAIMAKVRPMVVNVENRLMLPVSFWDGKRPTIKPVLPKDGKGKLTSKDIPDTVPFIEHRTYTLKPAKVQQYLDTLGADGFAMIETHAPCVGFYRTEAGALNQLISMWQFDSFEQRMERRAELAARPDWRKKVGPLADFVERIESKLLFCVPFYPGA
ncbi:MAG: NIPSNAP family protein [Alphaproteobacteria bacterium]